MKKYKVYDIKLIKQLKVCVSSKKKRTYWVFIYKKWKRVAKVYFVLLKKDIKKIKKKAKGSIGKQLEKKILLTRYNIDYNSKKQPYDLPAVKFGKP